MLFVEDDQPQIPHRREYGGARADDDRGITLLDALPFVPPLSGSEPAVHDGNAIPKARAVDGQSLCRQRNLRHQHDRLAAFPQNAVEDPQKDLRLAARRHSMKQEGVAPACLRGRRNLLHRRRLLGRQCQWTCLFGRHLPPGHSPHNCLGTGEQALLHQRPHGRKRHPCRRRQLGGCQAWLRGRRPKGRGAGGGRARPRFAVAVDLLFAYRWRERVYMARPSLRPQQEGSFRDEPP